MSIRDIEVTLLDGTVARFGDLAPGAALVVNVASKCGFTPQYAGLEALHREFAQRGLAVIGMPCNQFLKQEPGSAEEIGEFCSVNFGVTFALLAKGKVNGRSADALFKQLKRAKDSKGLAGPVLWNFEKFVLSADFDAIPSAALASSPSPSPSPSSSLGATPISVIGNSNNEGSRTQGIVRFRSATTPDDPALRAAIEAVLAAELGDTP